MTFLQAIILGIVEGITEFLPISSTGHLIVASHIMGLADTDFLKSFEIIIQLGAILAVIVLYFKMLTRNVHLWKTLIIAFIPTGIIGLATYSFVKKYLLGNTTVVLWSLFLGGLALISYELLMRRSSGQASSAVPGPHSISELSPRRAFLIGLIQSISIIPGVSRSAATIIGGSSVGLSRKEAIEFSFLLAVPTMLAASGLDIVKNIHLFTMANIGILSVGFITAFIVALASIVFLLRFVRNHTFIPFGIYRMIVAGLFFFLIH